MFVKPVSRDFLDLFEDFLVRSFHCGAYGFNIHLLDDLLNHPVGNANDIFKFMGWNSFSFNWFSSFVPFRHCIFLELLNP